MNDYVSLNEVIETFESKPIDEKLNVLRKYSRDVTYNSDYQVKVVEKKFLSKIVNDIVISKEEEKKLTYVRLFFMFLHNELGEESKYQIEIYKDVIVEQYEKVIRILKVYGKDKKVQKFLLGAFYKLFFLNTTVLSSLIEEKEYQLFIFLLKNITYGVDEKVIQEDKDIQEINDWIHIIFEYILKNEEICMKLDNAPFFNRVMKSVKEEKLLLLVEIIRDVVDYAKDSKVLLISLKHISTMLSYFIESLDIVANIIKESDLIAKYKELNTNEELVMNNRIVLCFIDVFSVLLTTEDLNNKEYREVIFEKLSNEEFYMKLLNLMYNTDCLYDEVFKRSKALKKEEKMKVPELEEKNIFFGFQTNIMKLLSNFCYKNEKIKQFFIDNPKHFYPLLNHIKMDKCNVFIKEWTVLMIKSLCDHNEKIQQLIKDLKPVEMDPLLKDYIINKGKQDIRMNDQQREMYFNLLKKKDH